MLKEELRYITTIELYNTNQLSNRTANCCKSIGLDTLYDIVTYFENNGSFLKGQKIKNAGRKTCEELDEVCATVISKIDNKELAKHEREIQSLLATKKRIFSAHCIDNFSFANDFYEKHGYFPMFWILEQYLINDNTKEVKILVDTFPIFQNMQPQGLKEVAVKNNLTKESVRIIRRNLFHRLFEVENYIAVYKNKKELFKYFQLLNNTDDWTYVLELFNKTHIVNQKPYSDEINEYLHTEQCNFSIKFVIQIIAKALKNEYMLWNGFDVFKRKKNAWRNIFLIHQDFSSIFDFEKFREVFNNMLSDNDTEYLLDVDDYVAKSDCWISYNFLKSGDITNIVRDILRYEFNLQFENIDRQIKIPVRKKINLGDIAYKILKAKDKPMHIDELLSEIKKNFPEYIFHQEKDLSRLRSYLLRHERISTISRKSLYALKDWTHVKSGTIRNAILEFLDSKDLPQTLNDITNHVLQFFPGTNTLSIRGTMRIDPQNRFSFLYGSLFGLSNKEYPPEYKKIIRSEWHMAQMEWRNKTFEQRMSDFEKFINKNGRFPFLKSDDKQEHSFYRWWYRIKNKSVESLTELQKTEIDRVKTQYADFAVNKNDYKWFLHFNEFRHFVLENRRLPSTIGSEKFLNSWFRKATDDFLNGRLSEKQRSKFNGISLNKPLID